MAEVEEDALLRGPSPAKKKTKQNFQFLFFFA